MMLHLTDDELDAATDEARKAAHEAPLNPLRTDHDGHRWIDQRSNAWAMRSREWMRLQAEGFRRLPF